jgi:saccharopine dehydrogenase (NADP+, L-glutamate forming)
MMALHEEAKDKGLIFLN